MRQAANGGRCCAFALFMMAEIAILFPLTVWCVCVCVAEWLDGIGLDWIEPSSAKVSSFLVPPLAARQVSCLTVFACFRFGCHCLQPATFLSSTSSTSSSSFSSSSSATQSSWGQRVASHRRLAPLCEAGNWFSGHPPPPPTSVPSPCTAPQCWALPAFCLLARIANHSQPQ